MKCEDKPVEDEQAISMTPPNTPDVRVIVKDNPDQDKQGEETPAAPSLSTDGQSKDQGEAK